LAAARQARLRAAEVERKSRGLEPQPLARRFPPAAGAVGVNLAGYARAEMGVGESVRSAARAARAAGLEYALLGVEAHPMYRASDKSAGELSASLPFPVTILHMNADQTPLVISELGARLDATRYRIGYWAWELDEFPERWRSSFEYVDEIWTPSEFCRMAIAAESMKPVLRMPHAVEPPGEAAHSREALGVPRAAFTALFAFDAMSVVERKNPLAAVEAFRKAFSEADDARLVLKISHAEAAPEALAEIRAAIGGAPVTLIDRVMDRGEMHSLIAHADCV
jgi:hypothetical protein